MVNDIYDIVYRETYLYMGPTMARAAGSDFAATSGATHRVLRALRVLNGFYAFAILVLLVMSIALPDIAFEPLGIRQAEGSDRLVRGMRLIMIVGLVGVPLADLILRRLIAIVETVRDGDPFVVDNGRRLTTIAWAVLTLELLHLAVGAIAASSGSSVQPLDIDWSFSFTPWLAVLLLFVLARVFDAGARMRADLAGTV